MPESAVHPCLSPDRLAGREDAAYGRWQQHPELTGRCPSVDQRDKLQRPESPGSRARDSGRCPPAALAHRRLAPSRRGHLLLPGSAVRLRPQCQAPHERWSDSDGRCRHRSSTVPARDSAGVSVPSDLQVRFHSKLVGTRAPASGRCSASSRFFESCSFSISALRSPCAAAVSPSAAAAIPNSLRFIRVPPGLRCAFRIPKVGSHL